MKKRGVVRLFVIPSLLISLMLIILLLFLLPFVLAASSSIDSEMQKISHYAQEFETGNIDYVKLMLYVSSAREGLNGVLGATNKEMGGIVKQEQIREILGEPNEETKWVWAEGEQQDVKLDDYVPIWKKIIFDGSQIQIRLEAFPSIFTKMEFDNEEADKSVEGMPEEGSIIYRLHFSVEFKKSQEQLDIKSKIDEIQGLAEIFNADSSQSNAEELAKQSVNAERIFQNYFQQNQGKCEDIMKEIFGSENQRQEQKLLVNEIAFYEGENFEAIIRLEMCDECEWNWVNFDIRFEGRGRFRLPKEENVQPESQEQFKNMNSEEFKSEITKIVYEMRTLIEQGDYAKALSYKSKLWALNEAWNQKSNDVWKEVDKEFPQPGRIIEGNGKQGNVVVENEVAEGTSQNNNQNNVVENNVAGNNVVENTITGNVITGNVIENNQQQESPESKDPYYWLKQDQEKRKKVKQLQLQNYEDRKTFYLNLFSAYDKKEYYFSQIEFQKRLVQEFREKGEEICNNNLDDNGNEQIDCDDGQCGGQICGKGTQIIGNGNETSEMPVDFYCISGVCQAREEIVKIKEAVCGNHMCEGNETIENCAEDCSLCPLYNAIECAGKVIFKGIDEKNCSLEPVCIAETEACQTDVDCFQPLCGTSTCVKINPEDSNGECKVAGLEECQEAQCSDGTTKVMKCASAESIESLLTINAEICEQGVWKKTGLECPGGKMPGAGEGEEEIEGEVIVEDIIGNECSIKEDCGGENDVCSNGKCVAIPQAIQIIEEPKVTEEGEQPQETGQEGQQEEQPAAEESPEAEAESSEPTITGEIIKTIKTFTGFIISGFQVEEGGGEESGISTEPDSGPDDFNDRDDMEGREGEPGPGPDNYEQGPREDGQEGDWGERDEDREDRGDEERGRNEQENKERCGKECARPCVEKCVREACGEQMDCDIDEESKKCESGCSADSTCVEKCMQGGDWWKEFQNQDGFKEEKGVFQAGGGCRQQQGRTEGFIWFGGWGDPFDKIQPLKNKYYSGGEADWCKYEVENLIKQREEFEKGFNQDFAVWFFEKYLPNAAEDWEQAVSGIFELYWANVDNQMQLARVMQCLEKSDINDIMSVNPINIVYETDYGKLEYWEEIKQVTVPGMDGQVTIVSPYMKVWVFPSKEFIKYEMRTAMENHEIPGPSEEKTERKNQEGLTEEEKQMIREDKGQMERIREISERYRGSLDLVIQFKDYETDEIVFNLYAQINENDLMKVEPMLPSEVGEKDVTVEMDFALLYEMIFISEKDMMGDRIESPPWDRQFRPIQKVKEVVNGVKIWNKMRQLKNSAIITPSGDEKTIEKVTEMIMENVMGGPGPKGGEQMEKEGEGKGDGSEGGKGGEQVPESFSQGISGKVVFVS